MYKIEVTDALGSRVVEVPASWDDISYEYYKERIEPHLDIEAPELKRNLAIITSMLGLDVDQIDITDYAPLLAKLLEWLPEMPQEYTFTLNDEEYKIPILGKSQQTEKRPFLSVGDWEAANDAMELLSRQEDLDKKSTADSGLYLLAAIARGPRPLDDKEFADRLALFKSAPMSVIMTASGFFLQYTKLSAVHLRPFSIKQKIAILKANRVNLILAGFSTLLKLPKREYSRERVAALLHWTTAIKRTF